MNPRNTEKSFSDIRIRFPFESSFCISESGCKLVIWPDIQLAIRIVIISDANTTLNHNKMSIYCVLLTSQ